MDGMRYRVTPQTLTDGQSAIPAGDVNGVLYTRKKRGTPTYTRIQPTTTAILVLAANANRIIAEFQNLGSVPIFLADDNKVCGLPLTSPINAASAQASTGGFLAPSTTYYYRISAINAAGETLPGTEQSTVVGATGTSTNKVTVNWTAVTGATGYKVYGRTTGAELLIATVSGNGTVTYDDTGAITPAGAMPTMNTTGKGFRLDVGGFSSDDLTAGNWYAITASGTGDLQIREVA